MLKQRVFIFICNSSSVLAVNAFDYWVNISGRSGIAKSIHIPSDKIAKVTFEKKNPILENSLNKSPNIDVVLNMTMEAIVP